LIRKLCRDDLDSLYVPIRELVNKSPKGYLVDTYRALTYMLHEAEAFDVDGMFVAFKITGCWFNDETILNELAVIRLRPEGKFNDAVDFLKAKAWELCADRIAVGTMLASNDRALSALYQRHGFTTVAHQLSKEIS